jgi:hypothetical protein
LEKFYKSDHCLKTNVAVLKKASSGSGDKDDNSKVAGDQEEGFIAKERAKKTRKSTRELHEFTGVPSEGERKCKGWSDEGMLAFEKHVTTIRKDVEDGKCVACQCTDSLFPVRLTPTKSNSHKNRLFMLRAFLSSIAELSLSRCCI